jgi:hypothetical protein
MAYSCLFLSLATPGQYFYLQICTSQTAGNSNKNTILSHIFRFMWPCIVSKIWRWKNQQDATIRCLLLTSVSTCFVHHYAHLQENKDRVTAFGVLFWFCWMWLVAFVGRCLVGCEQCESFCSTQTNRNFHIARILQHSAPQPLPTTSNRTRAIHQMQ